MKTENQAAPTTTPKDSVEVAPASTPATDGRSMTAERLAMDTQDLQRREQIQRDLAKQREFERRQRALND